MVSIRQIYHWWHDALAFVFLVVLTLTSATSDPGPRADAANAAAQSSSQLALLPLQQRQQNQLRQLHKQPHHVQRRRQVRWMVDAGRAKQGVQQWATHVASQRAITGLVGCCGRFHISTNGTWFDEWSESKFPLTNWNFTNELNLTMHFVVTVDQPALINQTALLAIPDAVATAVASNFTGYALDYETAPAGGWGSAAFQAETEGLLLFVTRFAAALRQVGKELLVDMGGTTAASLSTQGCSMNQTSICAFQKTLLQRWAHSGVSSLVEMGTYYGTDLGFNQAVLRQPLQAGIPAQMLSSGIGSSTTAGCGCGMGSIAVGNRSCCVPHACCGPAQSAWAHQPPFAPVPACVGAPCGQCKTLGTHLPCYNWTGGSLTSWVSWLTQNHINQISIFMATMDGAAKPVIEGRNATSPFFYNALRNFLGGGA